MLSKIRVLLLDDDPLVQTLLRLLLNATADLELIFATANMAQLLRLCVEIDPHILLIGGAMRHLLAMRHLFMKLLCFSTPKRPTPVSLSCLPKTLSTVYLLFSRHISMVVA